jgi:hypothetical protein
MATVPVAAETLGAVAPVFNNAACSLKALPISSQL